MAISPNALAEQIERQARQTEKAKEHEGIAPVLAEMRIGGTPESREALQALMRNALSSPSDSPLQPDVTVKVVGLSRDLERDGCEYLKMAYLFLVIMETPADIRDFVLAVCALSDGDSESFHPMPDMTIGELIGYERHAVKRKREALIAWQIKSTFTFIEIHENERDPITRHYLPTEYKVHVVPIIADFVRKSRAMRVKNLNYAQKQVIERGYHEIADELSSQLPVSDPVRRREGKTFFKPPTKSSQQMTLMHGQREQVILTVERFLRRTVDMKLNPREVWEELKKEVEIALYKVTLNTQWRE